MVELVCVPTRGNAVFICVGLSIVGVLAATLCVAVADAPMSVLLLGAVAPVALVLARSRCAKGPRRAGGDARLLGQRTELAERLLRCLRLSVRGTHRALCREFGGEFPPALVCLGSAEVPREEEYRHEPEVFPLRRSIVPIVILLAGLLLVRFVVVRLLPAVPATVFLKTALTLCSVATGVIAGTYWLLSGGRYLRIAPGLIQIVRFKRGRRDELVMRSYPVKKGTVIVLRSPAGFFKDGHPQILLFRRDVRDVLPLTGVDVPRLLRAITSTVEVSAERLSDETLLG